MSRRRGPEEMGLAPALPPSQPASTDLPMPYGDMLALAAWSVDPVGWCDRWLGATFWEAQKRIAEALVDYREVDVVTGHGVGKDYLAARLTLWWLCTHPDGIVLTTSAGERQVCYVLWGEIRAAYAKAKAPIGGQLAPVAPELRFGPKHYALGMVSKDTNAMGGFHEQYVLAIEDEAAGVSDAADQAMMGCASSANSRVLRIGNPTCGPTHQFAKSCARGHDPGKHITIVIPTTDTPNYIEGREVVPGLSGREYVESMAKKYGAGSAIYQARVGAKFPAAAADGLITYDHLNASRERAEREQDVSTSPKRIGCDVARMGDDLTVVYICQGSKAWIPEGGIMSKKDGPTIAQYLADIAAQEGSPSIAFDSGGVGASVLDSLIMLQDSGVIGADVEICPNDFGSRSTDPAEYADRRTELWWLMRDWLKDEGAMDCDEELELELLSPKYKWSGRAKRLEPKESIKARIGRSPDRADALALAISGHVGAVGSMPRLSVW